MSDERQHFGPTKCFWPIECAMGINPLVAQKLEVLVAYKLIAYIRNYRIGIKKRIQLFIILALHGDNKFLKSKISGLFGYI